jgi:hypothetical protein
VVWIRSSERFCLRARWRGRFVCSRLWIEMFAIHMKVIWVWISATIYCASDGRLFGPSDTVWIPLWRFRTQLIVGYIT